MRRLSHSILTGLSIAKDILATSLGFNVTPTSRRLSRWYYRRLIGLFTRHLSGPANFELEDTDFQVLCLVKNGSLHLEAFVAHYRQLGAKSIVFLDNGSSDGFAEKASQYPNVTVLRCRLAYRTFAWNFKPYLLERFGGKGWRLIADIDELFDYPRSNQISMQSLLDFLNKRQSDGLMAYKLDLFPNGPLSTTQHSDLVSACRYFDLSGIKKSRLDFVNAEEVVYGYAGGVHTVLGVSDIQLAKVPLVRQGGAITANNYQTHLLRGSMKLAPLTGVLKHYQFHHGFKAKCETSIKQQQYLNNSIEYKKYYKAMRSESDFNLYEEAKHPQPFTSPDALVDEAFLSVGKSYAAFVDGLKQ